MWKCTARAWQPTMTKVLDGGCGYQYSLEMDVSTSSAIAICSVIYFLYSSFHCYVIRLYYIVWNSIRIIFDLLANS